MPGASHSPLKTLHSLLQRPLTAHKYDFGHVLVIGGSPGMVGAPYLSAMAALRSGAGLVTIASSEAVIDKLETRVQEIMTFRLPEIESDIVLALQQFIEQRKVSVIVIGPGLDTAYLVWLRTLLLHFKLPLVIDAGALNVFHDNLDFLDQCAQQNADMVLTPHPGEYDRLSGEKVHDMAKKQIKKFASQHGVTLVFKQHPTLVASPGTNIYSNTTGNPGLATAGSGDVLTGIIAGIKAQQVLLPQAAAAAVYLHGLAADLAVESKTQPGLIASDLITCIPRAFRDVQSNNR